MIDDPNAVGESPLPNWTNTVGVALAIASFIFYTFRVFHP